PGRGPVRRSTCRLADLRARPPLRPRLQARRPMLPPLAPGGSGRRSRKDPELFGPATSACSNCYAGGDVSAFNPTYEFATIKSGCFGGEGCHVRWTPTGMERATISNANSNPRPLSLLSNFLPAVLLLARRQPPRCLHRSYPRVFLFWRRAGRGAGAGRTAARRPQLRLARLRQSRRCLSPGGALCRSELAAFTSGQCGNVSPRAAGSRGIPRRRDHRARPDKFRAPGHTDRSGRACADCRNDGGNRKAFRQTSARLARPVDIAVSTHPGSSAGGRLSLFASLVP